MHRNTDIAKVLFVRIIIQLLSKQHFKRYVLKNANIKERTENIFCKMKDFHFYESEIWHLTLLGKNEFKIIENRALRKTTGFNCSK